MKKETKGFFLPMTQEAIDSIGRHLDIHLAKIIFALLELRQNQGFNDDTPVKPFAELFDEEIIYRYNLNRMRWEIEQLFNITPPVVQTEIKEQLLDTVRMLERKIKRAGAIKELSESNRTKITYTPTVKGGVKEEKDDRAKSEQMNEQLFTSPLFDDYLTLLNSMLNWFKIAIAPFVYHEAQAPVDDYDIPADLGLYADDDIHKYITNWPAFIRICDAYSEPVNYEWVKRNKKRAAPNHRVIEKLEGEENYKWVGIPGGPIPSLTDFLWMLVDKGIFNPTHFSNAGNAVFKFFHITDKADAGFVVDDLYAAERPAIYKSCFVLELTL